MIFSGSEVKEGDHIFDVALGHGIVASVTKDYISARFGSRYLKYDQVGRCKIFNNRTLYWKDPFFGIEPGKNARNWQVLVNTAATLAQELIKLEQNNG